MPTINKKNVLRNETWEKLKKVPKVLKKHMELVLELERMTCKKKEWVPTIVLSNWSKYNNSEKYYFLGWLRAAVKKMGMSRTLLYIGLKDKQQIDSMLIELLECANENELQSFRNGEDFVNIHK